MSSDIDSILRSPKAYLWARKAIEAMEAHRVWPTALNFELWLHYVAAKDSTVAAEINTVLQSGTPFTDQVGEKIAAQHLPAAKLSGEILDAGKSLSQELDSVHRAIESARETSETYSQQLATASQSLEEQDSDAVRAMVENLSVATRKVREENQALESQLADTTDECCYELGLLVTEACTNAVVHSTPGSAVDISVVVEDRHCVLEIGNRGDTGTGRTTRQREEPLRTGGRGLTLMAALADTVAFVPAAPGQVLLRVTKHLPRLPRR